MTDEIHQAMIELAPLSDADKAKARDAEPANEPAAADRLRAFEDEHFGEKCVRINGLIERGSGSPFAMAAPEIRERHARIEKLLVTERRLADAHEALLQSDADHEAALTLAGSDAE